MSRRSENINMLLSLLSLSFLSGRDRDTAESEYNVRKSCLTYDAHILASIAMIEVLLNGTGISRSSSFGPPDAS
jgi:hypothetical protein